MTALPSGPSGVPNPAGPHIPGQCGKLRRGNRIKFTASAVAGNVRPRPVVQATLALATIRRRRSS
jgi:hypothetical protein